MHGTDVPAAMALLLEAHATDVRAWNAFVVTPAGTLAERTLERATVEVHHRDMAVQPVHERERAPARRAGMLPLLQVHRAVVLVHVALLSEAPPAHQAWVRLVRVSHARVRRQRRAVAKLQLAFTARLRSLCGWRRAARQQLVERRWGSCGIEPKL